MTKIYSCVSGDFENYKLYAEEKDWYRAKLKCQSDGGYLAVINSEAEAKLIEILFKNYTKHNYAHVGFSRHYVTQQFITIFGTCLQYFKAQLRF